jgi:hypothetical protein
MVADNNGAGAATRRPTDYTREIGLAICGRLIDGQGLRTICADAGMPDQATVHRWLASHLEFREDYASARKFQIDDLFDEILEIARDDRGDRIEKVRGDGRVVIVGDRKHMARCRLRIEVREWVADRLAPQGEDGQPKQSTIWSNLE